MKDEIVSGLKNAIDRGQPVELAAQSFINAGYNPGEVKAAVDEVIGYVATPSIYSANPVSANIKSPPVYSQQSQSLQNPSQFTAQNIPILNSQNTQQTEKPKKSRKILIFLVVIFLILIIVLGAITIFSEQLLNLLK